MDDDGFAVDVGVGVAGAVKAHGVIKHLSVKRALVIDILVHHVARMRAIGEFVAVGFFHRVEMAACGFKAAGRIAFAVFMNMKRHPLAGRKAVQRDFEDRSIGHTIDRKLADFRTIGIDKAALGFFAGLGGGQWHERHGCRTKRDQGGGGDGRGKCDTAVEGGGQGGGAWVADVFMGEHGKSSAGFVRFVRFARFWFLPDVIEPVVAGFVP